MTAQPKYLMTAVISSILAFGYLTTTSSTAFAKVTVGNNQQTNQTKTNSQVYSIDEWPEVREELCGKCKSDPKSEENKVSVPEPSSVIALLILGGSLLLTKNVKSNYLTLTKK